MKLVKHKSSPSRGSFVGIRHRELARLWFLGGAERAACLYASRDVLVSFNTLNMRPVRFKFC